MMCGKCSKLCGITMLVVGLLFLLQDLKIWMFWDIHWYTALFVFVGLSCVAGSSCPDCKGMCKK